MTSGRTKKVSELNTVNSVANSDTLITNSNVSGNITTSTIAVSNFVNSAIGNVYSYQNYITYSSGNVSVVANGSQNVSYFTYNRALYAGVKLTIDMYSNTDGKRTFGEVFVTANSTVANIATGTLYVHVGGAPNINPQKNADVSGNTVSLYLDGPTGNVQVRYLATLFKV